MIWTSKKKTLRKTPDTIFLFPTCCAFFKIYALQINILINTITEAYVVFYLFRLKPVYNEVSWSKAICDSYCEAHPCLKAVIDPAVCSEESEIIKHILKCYILGFFYTQSPSYHFRIRLNVKVESAEKYADMLCHLNNLSSCKSVCVCVCVVNKDTDLL